MIFCSDSTIAIGERLKPPLQSAPSDTTRQLALPARVGIPMDDPALFAAVQALLDAQAPTRRLKRTGSRPSPYTGRLFDAQGSPMSPTFSLGAAGQRYRYYVSASLQQGVQVLKSSDIIRRVNAGVLEEAVTQAMNRFAPEADPILSIIRIDLLARALRLTLITQELAHQQAEPRQILDQIRKHLPPDATAKLVEDGAHIRVELPACWTLRGGRTRIITPATGTWVQTLRPDPALIRALRRGHQLLAAAGLGQLGSRDGPQSPKSPLTVYHRRLAGLAHLAPALQKIILEGRQPFGMTLQALIREPLRAGASPRVR